jgi:hypothetical protein
MKKIVWPELTLRALLIAIAVVSPTVFPASQAGYSTLHALAFWAIIPAATLLAAAWVFLRRSRFSEIAAPIRDGATAGALATIALEAVRYSGFRMGFMPGNLPELMGVLLFDRFALGPTPASTLVGFVYHFWNGACFGIIFALGRFRPRSWWAIPYGLLIGIGFLLSPVVQGLSVGLFGINFGWHFAATVLLAHLAFGSAMAWLLGCNSVLTRPISLLKPVRCRDRRHPDAQDRFDGGGKRGIEGRDHAYHSEIDPSLTTTRLSSIFWRRLLLCVLAVSTRLRPLKPANNLPYDSKARRLIFSGGAQSDPTISSVNHRP